ncbi:MAG: class I SAM-dependent methyltransferase [Planctomycetes bacterium]|nr:class I SAM-dependent methyltransferase [Planctomycetota bacterium]
MSSPERHRYSAIEGEHWWYRGRRKVYLSHLRAAIGGVPVGRALDLGGGDTMGLAPFARDVVGLDLDGAERARARAGGARVAGKALALPFADRAFDLVTAFDVLERVEDEEQALAEVRRVLRPGGLAMLSVPAYDWLHAHQEGDVRRYTRARIRRALEAADFTVERTTHANVVLFPLIAPTVLAFELLQRLRVVPTSSRHTNLSVPTPPWLAALLYRAFTSELSLSGRFDLPFGHSIVALARRPIPARTKRVKRRAQLRVRALASEPAAPLPSATEAVSSAPRPSDAPLPERGASRADEPVVQDESSRA